MTRTLLSLSILALSATLSVVNAAPKPWGPTPHFPNIDSWNNERFPGKYEACTDDNVKIRKDFDSMAPQERKAYTDAVKCIMAQPSQLDQTLYPAAINRYFDYAVVHTNLTEIVHLSAYFLTWHRYYLHLFEEDLRQTCGYQGAFPYWNWPATADNLHGSAVFDGSEYSMSGDGEYVDTGPVMLSPNFSLPHGSGGGCVTSGPFANMETTIQPISIQNLLMGAPLPENAFALNRTCLTRDLNTYVAQTWCNETALYQALESDDIATFDTLINGVAGGGSLGLHSGAHFVVGSPGSNIFVSVQDPIWWPLHTFLDNLYTSWQARHPDLANSVFGTLTANDAPPSANGTLDSQQPGWGYFETNPYTIGELISTTSGPFCYKYDVSL
ncbi:hypothetical protein H2204_010330 [Knufia peltigerae]|uniref:Tyrosinase copper-binding domain-containing protein n=1 Tax=Knufia peltigerae TaxID=1002370 RepID=A0AA38XXB7_9EURO|nr:hypothetical protein H2204_010330 [Knufia peltigerae]